MSDPKEQNPMVPSYWKDKLGPEDTTGGAQEQVVEKKPIAQTATSEQIVAEQKDKRELAEINAEISSSRAVHQSKTYET